MKILLVLPDKFSAFVMLRIALESLGHTAEIFFYRSEARYSSSWSKQICERFKSEDLTTKMNNALIRKAEQTKPDLIFINKGEIIYATTIQTLTEKHGIRTVSWYVDSPLWIHSSSQHILESLRCVDVAFVFDGYYIPEMLRWGCQRAASLSFGCEPSIHKPVTLINSEASYYKSEICFIGSYHGVGSSRERILRELTNYNLKIWGEGWSYSSFPELTRCWMGHALAQTEIAKAYSGAQMTVNITYPHSITQPNMRTFEAPACGTLLLNDMLGGLEEYFEVGKEIEVYNSPDELLSKVDYYLNHPEKARVIGDLGCRRAHRDHTYRQRMEEMLAVVFG